MQDGHKSNLDHESRQDQIPALTSVLPTREPARGQAPGQPALPPVWTRWTEIPRVVFHPPYLRRTIRIALLVGSVLFAINHLDEVIRGQASPVTWIKGAFTCLVPFCVSNTGVLIAARRPAHSGQQLARRVSLAGTAAVLPGVGVGSEVNDC
jgi:hypothetical protein